MYAVVGCNECGALWVVADRPETTGCPRCGKRHRYDRLKRFATTDDEDVAREARARLLADRAEHAEAFAEVAAYAELEADLDDAGIPDEEYLSAAGIDPAVVAAAGERASGGRPGGSTSRREAVLVALRELDRPTEDEVVAHAAEHGVPAEYVRDALAKLVQAGEATETGGRYRLL